jgi:hypothetical protein
VIATRGGGFAGGAALDPPLAHIAGVAGAAKSRVNPSLPVRDMYVERRAAVRTLNDPFSPPTPAAPWSPDAGRAGTVEGPAGGRSWRWPRRSSRVGAGAAPGVLSDEAGFINAKYFLDEPALVAMPRPRPLPTKHP